MNKTAITVGNWRFKRIDSLNWQVFERREVLAGKRKGEVDWTSRPSYFGELVNAVQFARNREFDRKGDFESFDAVLGEMRAIDARFVRELKAAVADAAD